MTGRRIDPDWFEGLYQSRPDPWSFATSSYEAAKYARTLAALGPPERRFARALEAGCSIGVFTELLAPRCDELVAIDASSTAVARASERLRGVPHVRVLRRTLPEELPPGPFDLIVCSEILYYWSADLLRELLAALESTLVPGGASWPSTGGRPPAPIRCAATTSTGSSRRAPVSSMRSARASRAT